MPVYLSLGSNVGDRETNLRSALELLRSTPGVTLTGESGIYETEPVGDVDQPAFLNMASAMETTLEPLALLARLKEIESVIGRVPTRRWGPRVIDIDIVLWDELVLSRERLKIPHSEFRNRAFVLVPLAEIAPNVVDPVTGMSVAELLARVGNPASVHVFAG